MLKTFFLLLSLTTMHSLSVHNNSQYCNGGSRGGAYQAQASSSLALCIFFNILASNVSYENKNVATTRLFSAPDPGQGTHNAPRTLASSHYSWSSAPDPAGDVKSVPRSSSWRYLSGPTGPILKVWIRHWFSVLLSPASERIHRCSQYGTGDYTPSKCL